jgi:hypothetical protein
LSFLLGERREVVRHDDGYLTVTDPDRGIGIIAESLTLPAPSWGVLFLIHCMDRPALAQWRVEYGKN